MFGVSNIEIVLNATGNPLPAAGRTFPGESSLLRKGQE
jgi:hypothetical protein